MQRWEYKHVDLDEEGEHYVISPGWFKEIGHPDNLPTTFGSLNDLGQEGWEIITVAFDPEGVCWRAWLKRPCVKDAAQAAKAYAGVRGSSAHV